MSKFQRLVFLILADIVAINLTNAMFLWVKFAGGGLPAMIQSWQRLKPINQVPDFWFALSFYADTLPLISAFWFLLFFFFGLFRISSSPSRFDEFIDVFKIVSIGVMLAFVATFDQGELRLTRLLIFFYWLMLIFSVSCGRILIRSFERSLLLRGVGRRRTMIVGTDVRAERLLNDLELVPDREFDVVGFAFNTPECAMESIGEYPVLGSIADLSDIIRSNSIDVVLIALQSNSHEEILDIVSAARGETVSFSITPDLYDIVTGHARTMQISGVPLMQLNPELIPVWEGWIKRLIDIVFSLLIIGVLSPLWFVIAVVIKVSSEGPILFRQERVGINGKTFTMYKFRSMRMDAESETGPVWVKGEDPRVTLIGRLLRMLHLDEIPQCINFLRGDMSLVGPRPERPFFVEKFRSEIPLYMRRFNVKPGLLGWAQAKHEFDMNSEDVIGIARERLEYDLHYIENMSLKLDIKIIFQTIWFVLSGKSTR